MADVGIVGRGSTLAVAATDARCMVYLRQYPHRNVMVVLTIEALQPSRSFCVQLKFPSDQNQNACQTTTGPAGLQHGGPPSADQRREPSSPDGAAEQRHRQDVLRARLRQRELSPPCVCIRFQRVLLLRMLARRLKFFISSPAWSLSGLDVGTRFVFGGRSGVQSWGLRSVCKFSLSVALKNPTIPHVCTSISSHPSPAKHPVFLLPLSRPTSVWAVSHKIHENLVVSFNFLNCCGSSGRPSFITIARERGITAFPSMGTQGRTREAVRSARCCKEANGPGGGVLCFILLT